MRRKTTMSVNYRKVVNDLTDVIKELNVGFAPCAEAAPAAPSQEERQRDAVGLVKALLSGLEQGGDPPSGAAAAAAAEHGAGAAGVGNFIQSWWANAAKMVAVHDNTYVFVTVYDKLGRPAKSAMFMARSENEGTFKYSLHDSFRGNARVDKVTGFINKAREELGNDAGYKLPNAPLTWDKDVAPLLSYRFSPKKNSGESFVAYQFEYSEKHWENGLWLNRSGFWSDQEVRRSNYQMHHNRANGIE
jgi:hypothetical protein